MMKQKHQRMVLLCGRWTLCCIGGNINTPSPDLSPFEFQPEQGPMPDLREKARIALQQYGQLVGEIAILGVSEQIDYNLIPKRAKKRLVPPDQAEVDASRYILSLEAQEGTDVTIARFTRIWKAGEDSHIAGHFLDVVTYPLDPTALRADRKYFIDENNPEDPPVEVGNMAVARIESSDVLDIGAVVDRVWPTQPI